MTTQFFSIGLLMLFSAMLPGPDFAIVTKNTLAFSRRAGLFTSVGIGTAIFIHMCYCILGVGLLIANSPLLFNAIKYMGAVYLIYLGTQSLLIKVNKPLDVWHNNKQSKHSISDWSAFTQGFLCNLFNPKATLFFLAFFTVIINPSTSFSLEIAYATEMIIIAISWFCLLTILLSHPMLMRLLARVEGIIIKLVGFFLIGFGIALTFVKI